MTRNRSALFLTVVALLASSCAGSGEETVADTGAPERLFDEIDVQGHRGARGLKPENTLPAFETALDLGVSTLELDLHFTSDGDIVISHDPAITADKCGLRTGSPQAIPDPDDPQTPTSNLAIRAMTAETLSWYDCNRNPDVGKFPQQNSEPTALAGNDYSMITLTQLFDFVDRYATSETKTEAQRENARRVLFNVETKRKENDPARIGDGFDGVNAGPFEIRVLEVITDSDVRERVIVQSFDLRSIAAINAIDPTIRLAALTSDASIDLDRYAQIGASIWSPKASTVTADRIGKAHELGLAVIPWTVNDLDDIARLLALGVDGIITDRPDLFADQ
jgi:glycerophosphoryl diester phosphodiesterase